MCTWRTAYLNLNPTEILALPDELGVRNCDNDLIGYIHKETLLYLNKAAKGSILEQIMDKYPEGVLHYQSIGKRLNGASKKPEMQA